MSCANDRLVQASTGDFLRPEYVTKTAFTKMKMALLKIEFQSRKPIKETFHPQA